MAGPTKHQSQQGFPQLSSPFVDEQGYIIREWLRLLQSLWVRDISVGGSPEPQVVGSNPFMFSTDLGGTLGIEFGNVALSRDGGTTFYPIGQSGGAVVLLPGDTIRVSWTGASTPRVTFFPSGLS